MRSTDTSPIYRAGSNEAKVDTEIITPFKCEAYSESCLSTRFDQLFKTVSTLTETSFNTQVL